MIIKTDSAVISKIKGMVAFIKDGKTFIGKESNYDNKGNYNNHDESFRQVSSREKLFHILSSDYSPEALTLLIAEGNFTLEDFKEYAILIEEFNIPLYA